MKNIILISIISLIGFSFYGCTTAYKTVTVYTTDTITGKPIKKVTKFYDTQTTYYNNVSPYPYYYANPYWYGGWYGGWGSPYYGNNYVIIRPNNPAPRPHPRPNPSPRPMGPAGGYHRGRN